MSMRMRYCCKKIHHHHIKNIFWIKVFFSLKTEALLDMNVSMLPDVQESLVNTISCLNLFAVFCHTDQGGYGYKCGN